jgi:serine/threonine protein kinase
VSQESERSLAIGTMIAARYRVESVIGVGGFGMTYRAHDATLARVVAVKEHVPPGSLRHANGFLELPTSGDIDLGVNRFVDEGRRVAQLRHPSIVRVHDVIQDFGTGYLVMEYLQGETLQQTVERHGAIASSRVVAITRQLGEGLAHMHNDTGDPTRSTLLHLDISPGNVILVTDPGGVRPVLIDFGSARALTTNVGHQHTRLVKDGYSPPELYELQTPRTKATDVYSFSATLYYAISGESPPGFGQVDSAMHHLQSTRPDVPTALHNAIESGLQLLTVHRPSSLSEFMHQIDAATPANDRFVDTRRQATMPPTTPISVFPGAPPKPSALRPLAIGGAIAAVGLIGVLTFLLTRRDTTEISATTAVTTATEVTTAPPTPTTEPPTTADAVVPMSQKKRSTTLPPVIPIDTGGAINQPPIAPGDGEPLTESSDRLGRSPEEAIAE